MEDRIKYVLNHIEENLDTRLNLNELAALACLSPSQFHRQFKRQTGRTPFKFVEELKMNKAYQLILEGRLLINALSLKFGYSDYETFSRTFKKYFHFSPDDLKAIAEGVKAQIATDDPKEVMILTLDDEEGIEEVVKQLMQFLEEKGVSRPDLINAQAFKIFPKTLVDMENGQLIKNKFALRKEEKLWRSLIESHVENQRNLEDL